MEQSKRAAYYRTWYAQNRERELARVRAWKQSNPDKVRAQPSRRRADVVPRIAVPEGGVTPSKTPEARRAYRRAAKLAKTAIARTNRMRALLAILLTHPQPCRCKACMTVDAFLAELR